MCLIISNFNYLGLVLCLSAIIPLSVSSNNNNSLLLILSFDGFRYDYVERNLTTTLVSLRENSSFVHHMLSVFPSKTFPNHFSIATGLYTEVHGVLDNEIFDQSTNKTLVYGYDLYHYNEEVVPLWTLNERAGGGRRSGCVMYPGCNFKYQEVNPSHYLEYNMSVAWHHRVDIVLDWFQHPDTPINLGMVYFEQPDTVCHKYGPDSAEVDAEISRVDETVAYLLRGAQERGLLERLNIVLLSDHGAQAVLDPEHMISLETYADTSLYRRDGIPPNLQIFPEPGMESQLLQSFREARSRGANFTAYTRDEMPERWHYKNCARTPPVLAVADLGYLFTTDKKRNNPSPVIGNHGYDPLEPSMWAFFMAFGPMFKRNFTVQPFENIHIYPLAAHLLGLQLPSLKPNGSITFLQDILVIPLSTKEEIDTTTYYVAVFILIALMLILGVTWIAMRANLCQKDKSRRSAAASYQVLEQGADEQQFFGLRETLSSDCEEDSPT